MIVTVNLRYTPLSLPTQPLDGVMEGVCTLVDPQLSASCQPAAADLKLTWQGVKKMI